MSIPVIPNPSYPLVAPAVSLINAYLEQDIPEPEPEPNTPKLALWSRIWSHWTLQLRLPHESGSTFICHQAAQFASAFIVLQNDPYVKHFRHEHEIMFTSKCQIPVFSVYELKNARSICLLDPDLARLSHISKSLSSSSLSFST